MSGQDDDTERPHEATAHKLAEARKKGDLPRTADLTAAIAMAAILAMTFLPGGWAPPRIGEIGAFMLADADTVGASLLGDGSGLFAQLLKGTGIAMAPYALVPGVCVIAALIGLRSLVFAPQKLAPKASRVSILSNAKNKFGPSGLMEFAKSTAKLTIYGVILWAFLSARLPRLMATVGQSPGQASAEMMTLLVEFLALIVLIMIAIGGLDYLWQIFDHRRKQRMSHKEMRDEHKESEGDPHMKQQRRQRATEIATNQMLNDVPQAAVVIVNPTHYAVALKWSPDSETAPICVAKGVDEIAARIREAATEAGVPIHSDPPTARALHATVEIGGEISPDHYAPVAAAIRFAEMIRQKAAKRWGAK